MPPTVSTLSRHALAYLGLVDRESPAIDTETMMAPDPDLMGGRGPKSGPRNLVKYKHVAQALRRLADGIEKGDIEMVELFIDSRLGEDWLVQNLHIQFEVRTREFPEGGS